MDFDKAVAELEALVETLEREGDERALYLLQLIDTVHRPALERMAVGDFEDPIVEAVLYMYEIVDVVTPEDDARILAQIEKLRRPTYADVSKPAAELESGELTTTKLDGVGVLLANLDGEIYALRDGCPVDGNSLGGARENYQILTPSTWMASPKDPFGNPGPYEEAVHATPLLENFEKPEDYKGIDILRAIRSFDPCMPCTTHIHTENRVISRDVVTCACGVDDEHEH